MSSNDSIDSMDEALSLGENSLKKLKFGEVV